MASGGGQRVSWRRVGICLLIVLGGLYLLLPAVHHVMVWYMAHYETADASPLVPQILHDTGIDPLKGGETLVSFGFTLRVPWKVAKRENARSLAILSFDNGVQITIFDQKDYKAGQVLSNHTSPSEAAKYKAMYGSKAISSEYEFVCAELNASPDEVSFWRSNAINAGVMTQLIFKSSLLNKAKVLYSVEAGDVRGFQIGDAGSSVIHLMLFDREDRELWIVIRPSTGAGMTQAQINGIVSSIQSHN